MIVPEIQKFLPKRKVILNFTSEFKASEKVEANVFVFKL